MTEKEYIFRELSRISRDIESLKNMVSKITYDYYDTTKTYGCDKTGTTAQWDTTTTTGTSAIDDYVAMCTDNGRRNK
jgi:hypothetical protein